MFEENENDWQFPKYGIVMLIDHQLESIASLNLGTYYVTTYNITNLPVSLTLMEAEEVRIEERDASWYWKQQVHLQYDVRTPP
jgi:predicted deacetylase